MCTTSASSKYEDDNWLYDITTKDVMILRQWTWSDLDYASNNNNDNGKTKKSCISFEDLNISFRLNTWKETDSSYDSSTFQQVFGKQGWNNDDKTDWFCFSET